MNKVTFPLKPPMQGPAVADLQNALQAFLERRAVLANDAGSRQQFSSALQRERVGQAYESATRKLVAVIQQEKQLVVGAGNEGSVDEQTAATINAMLRELGLLGEDVPTGETVYKVSGTVRFADGLPAAGLSVSAFDRDLRNEQPLRPSEIGDPPQTDRNGKYEIQYFASQFRNREKLTADIVVKVFAADGSRLAMSPVLFNSPPLAQVDVTIPAEALKSPTLFERIDDELAPLLGDVTLSELEEDSEHQDVTFLAGETGFSNADVARFIMAHRLVELGIQPEFWFVLLGGASFPLAEDRSLRQRISAIVDLLPTLDARAVNKALIAGFNQREIPESLQSRVAEWVEAFLQIIASRSQSKSPTVTFVRAALEEAGVKDAAKQGTFVRLFNEHRALTPELLKALETDTSFRKEEIAELRTSFELADLTRGDFSVVGMLKREAGIHQPERIRSLAKKSVTEWVDLVRTTHAAGEITLPINLSDDADAAARVPKLDAAEVYGQMIERQFREAFPTVAFSGGLERAIQSGEIRGLRQPETLSRFLESHDRFELLNTPIDDFLDRGAQPGFASLVSDKGFRQELKAVQRVFKVAPNFSATRELLADDMHSAQQIYRVGQSEFVRGYASRPGFTEESARLAWNRAANTHAAVLTVVADLKSLDAEALPQALKSGPTPLSNFPNWNNLFQSGDLCECEQCRSVLSPAAYFAELLMFLKDRKSAKPPQTVKDILFNRRPDLGYLELNCENALTLMPYIDTVCEVMEDVVAAGRNDLELAGFAAMPANAVAAKKAVADAFAAEAIDLGGDFALKQVSAADPNRWVVHGEAVTYLLKKKATPNFFAEILRNTKASAAELRAFPQYINPKAYESLRAAKYPLSLPFDLFAEEIRAAFQKSNLQRWDLMRALRGAAAPNNATDGEIAAEYFGISVDAGAPFDEQRLLLVADATVAGQKLIWGESSANWLSLIGNVKNFLRKTSLEYDELLALLDLKFINPTGALGIHHLDASCDTDKKIIQVLDAARLDAIHRFLRLWRKLKGWRMWELDLVVRHPAIGNGALDEAFLIDLFHFARLKNRLGNKVTVEQVCGLFGKLNTATAFTGLYEKRADAHYQSLFLNKRLVHPLDPAFRLDPATLDVPAGETLTAHHPALLAALGVRDADLNLLKALTKASDGTPYIDDDLTLANLSFLWRHAWLSKSLQLKSDDWPTILKLFQQDVDSFPTPQAAWQFVEQVDLLRASGFTGDDLNWLLAADRTSKAAIKETDAAHFLTALRKDLEAILAEYDPAQYEFLTAAPPSDTERLTALLTTLLQKLNRDEAAAQQFIAALRDEIVQEKTVMTLPAGFSFPAAISGAPNNIAVRYEPMLRFTGPMTAGQRTVLLTDAALAAVTGKPGYQQAIADLFLQPGSVRVNDLPAGFTFPATITGAPNNIPIRYEPVLRLTGVLTAAQKSTLLTSPTLAAVTGIATYQQAVEEFFATPRLAFKFFEPNFTAPLRNLPAAVDFKLLADPALALKISYDAELRLLRFNGVLSSDEKAALDGLSANVDYRNAVNSIASQPTTIAPPDERIWLLDADLKFPLRDLDTPANDHLASNLAVAVTRALAYLSKSSSQQAVVTQASGQLDLTEAVTRRLMTSYAVLPDTLLKHFTEALPATSGVVDYATLQATFDGWFWAARLGTLLRKWSLSLDEWERLDELTVSSRLLDVQTLPLNSLAAIASTENLLRTSRLLRLHASLPEPEITLLEVLQQLNAGAYATVADFAMDVQGVNDAWPAVDVEAFVAAVDAAYPADYLLAETWERMGSAFPFVDQLNAGIDTVKTFAAAAMSAKHSSTLQGLLRSKLGTESSLQLITEIQDVLRERKRDALCAYLLAQAMPADAPSGKWENTNDLYAYYLLDVEMCSCQLTSRLVQGSGSVQLFVQRCLMGLEPDVKVEIDGDHGDSAWRWWQWMSKYRVWEANRKVFLWPENWIEPELKKDRSPFFRDLENELMQNEVNPFTVETAYSNYLEKLDGVAQLEIAGFYQEDDGDNTIIHVFGRTRSIEPHLYYYRRFDYRQWTAWEKVDLDIQGDYLTPAVINKRLFLFWPVFTETPDESGNSNVSVPQGGEPSATLPKTRKKLKMQMAVSDYRQGAWTPKRVSTDFDGNLSSYDVEIHKTHYEFYAIDKSGIDGTFTLQHRGHSVDNNGGILDRVKALLAGMLGAFDVTGCKGVPVLIERQYAEGYLHAARPERAATGGGTFAYDTISAKWLEQLNRADAPQNDLTLVNQFPGLEPLRFAPVLMQTPDLFAFTPPWHLSYFDRLLLDGNFSVPGSDRVTERVIGSWLPFFYNDRKRTFFVLPSLGVPADRATGRPGSRSFYPEIKRDFRLWEAYFEGQVVAWLNTLDPTTWPPALRQAVSQSLAIKFPEIAPPRYTDEQLKALMQRSIMRFFHYYLGIWSLGFFQFRQFEFRNFYHPFICDFVKLVDNPLKGIPALMSRETQLRDTGFSFNQTYQPTVWVVEPGTEECYPREMVDFTPDGACSIYNWELFFHAPLLIANSLSRNQRFAEARDWYHFMFNPIGRDSPKPGAAAVSKYWITKPFFETTDLQYVQQRIENIMSLLAGDTSAPGYSAQARKDLEDQVRDWRTNPFEPHRIASYRTVAYQKTVLMKYLDNLIAWGDYLFRQDSMESINEATQLYILAAELLGPSPKRIPPQARPPLETFNELEDNFDAFSNALVEVENLIPALAGDGPDGGDAAPLPVLYFCIPHNEKMLGYWSTVADRLYKIRHCMNIDGVVRQLALFEPPIDPALLVKAVAGGLDIGSALASLSAPLPSYRFSVLLQNANEVCADVRALGAELLAALEKKDAETLGLLRQTHEIRTLEAVKAVREQQIEEATNNLEGLMKNKEQVTIRRDYYQNIEKISAGETLQQKKLEEALIAQQISQVINIAASIAHAVPSFDIGAAGIGGTPRAGVMFGGPNIGSSLQAEAGKFNFWANVENYNANKASINAGHERRWEDWKLQERLANKELEQLDKSIAAAEVRVAIAGKELANQKLLIENARALDDFMRSKYTNQELFQWQIGQISGVYFQSYRLAYDLATRAERCFRFELGLPDSSFIDFGYWDSLKKGLLSGEKLQYDLRRLESAWLERNRREFELTKHVSLALLDPLALVRLRETGRCFFRLPEEIFDLDYPGHYFRRIKSVSLTLPCVTGPYTTATCTLRLLKNSIRASTSIGNGYARNTDDQGTATDDDRFVENNIPVKAVAASSAQNDSGMFELNFRDERYLPFEGAGVLSEWSLELFSDLPANNPDPSKPDFGRPLRQFDYETISDAILHVKYSAREDAGAFKNGAVAHLRDYLGQDDAAPSVRMLDLRREFPNGWHTFLNPPNPANGNILEFEMAPNLFRTLDGGKTLKVNTMWLLARCTNPAGYSAMLTAPPAVAPVAMSLVSLSLYGGLHFSQKEVALEVAPTGLPLKWQLKVTPPHPGVLQKDPVKMTMEVEDVYLVLGYEWE